MPVAHDSRAGVRGSRDLEAMWKALLKCRWSRLAIVPTDPGVSVQSVVDAFETIRKASSSPIRCIDARGVDVTEGKRLAQEIATPAKGNSRAVVVVDSLIGSLSGVHLVDGVNAVLLVLRVGAMDLESLRSTVTMVGAERIVGSVTAPLDGWPADHWTDP